MPTLGVHNKCRARFVFVNIKLTRIACNQRDRCDSIAWSNRPELRHRGAAMCATWNFSRAFAADRAMVASQINCEARNLSRSSSETTGVGCPSSWRISTITARKSSRYSRCCTDGVSNNARSSLFTGGNEFIPSLETMRTYLRGAFAAITTPPFDLAASNTG